MVATSLKNTLDSLLHGYEDNWRFRLIKEWDSIIGPLHQHMRLEKIDGQTAILGVYDIHWMHELYLFSRTIIRTINTALGSAYITTVRFKIVVRHTSVQADLVPPRKNDNHVSAVLTSRERHALNVIHDDELKHALQAFLQKMKADS